MKAHIKYGLYCVPIGLIIGIYIATNFIEPEEADKIFPFTAPLAIFLCGSFLWKRLMKGLTFKRAFLTGFLTGTLSHYLCWEFYFIWILITDREFSSGMMLMEILISFLIFPAFCSVFSLMFFGIYTLAWAVIAALILTEKCQSQIPKKLNGV